MSAHVQDLGHDRAIKLASLPRGGPRSRRRAQLTELQTAMEGVVVGESPSKARKAETLALLADLRDALQQLEEARKKAEASSGDYAAQLLEQKSRNEALEETSTAQRRGTKALQALPHVVMDRMLACPSVQSVTSSPMSPQRTSDCRCSSPS